MSPNNIANENGDLNLQSVPGVVVGVLLLIAAIMWFDAYRRYKAKRAMLWLAVAAVALIIAFGYLRALAPGGAA